MQISFKFQCSAAPTGHLIPMPKSQILHYAWKKCDSDSEHILKKLFIVIKFYPKYKHCVCVSVLHFIQAKKTGD